MKNFYYALMAASIGLPGTGGANAQTGANLDQVWFDTKEYRQGDWIDARGSFSSSKDYWWMNLQIELVNTNTGKIHQKSNGFVELLSYDTYSQKPYNEQQKINKFHLPFQINYLPDGVYKLKVNVYERDWLGGAIAQGVSGQTFTIGNPNAQNPANNNTGSGGSTKSKHVPPGYTLVDELSDEFDGGWNDKKWLSRHPFWDGHAPGKSYPENSVVAGGKLNIKTTTNAPSIWKNGVHYHTFKTGMVHSTHRIKYGYFEVFAKMSKSRISSAFWLIANDFNGNKGMSELDIFEYSHGNYNQKDTPQTINLSTHMWRQPWESNSIYDDRASVRAPKLWFNPADGFHTYSLEWDNQKIIWKVDGYTMREEYGNHGFHQALNVLMDTETQEKWMGLPQVNNLNNNSTDYEIDYIRVYRGPQSVVTKGIHGYQL